MIYQKNKKLAYHLDKLMNYKIKYAAFTFKIFGIKRNQ